MFNSSVVLCNKNVITISESNTRKVSSRHKFLQSNF